MNNGDTVYIVGLWRSDEKPWELIGVFLTADEAESACTSPSHFFGEEVVGVRLPDETTPWIVKYPYLEKGSDE